MGIATVVGEDFQFPPARTASPEGIVVIGGVLSPKTLCRAYSQGIFPWPVDPDYPVFWFCPPQRMVIELDRLHLSRSLRKVIQSRRFEVRMDTAFERVVRACAAVERADQDGTWIDERMVKAYLALHGQGVVDGVSAHSVEAWEEGQLVGGLYGVSVGGVFSGESMFALKPNASKVALAGLVERMLAAEMALLDCQVETDHLASMGGTLIDREEYLERLSAVRHHKGLGERVMPSHA
jgi:leucyl/phenylalanyl-tRNA--protein transferase